MGASLNPLYAGLARFAAWWLGELMGLLPVRLRAPFGHGRPVLMVEIGERTATLDSAKGGVRHRLGEVKLDEGAGPGGRDEALRLIRRGRLGGAELAVVVPAGQALRQVVELPAAANENLREVVAFEMDRHTPFKAEDVYFDCRVVRAEPRLDRISVDLAVVPKDVADGALRVVRAWGLDPDRLEVAGADAGGLNLLPAAGARAQGSASRRLSLMLAACAAGLVLLIAYLPLLRQQAQLSQIDAELTQARADAVAVDRLKTRVASLAERGGFFAQRKAATPTVTEVFQEVTRLLPDNTYLAQFGVRGDQLALSGYSGKASALIAQLEQSELLAEVRFSSPVTLDRRVGLDRFNLAARVAPRTVK